MNKSDQAYKTIGEVVKILDLKTRSKQKTPTHTIRYWEKEFKQIKPKIFTGNRRYYNNDTIEVLIKIK
jgi:DNA-binding transcriptional MerR regulator